MKNIILSLALIFAGMVSFAQEDTTKVEPNMNLEKELENLDITNNGENEFEMEIQKLQKELKTLQNKKKAEGIAESTKIELEKMITETEKKIAALEKGIEDMEKINEDNDVSDNDDDEDDDNNFNFDWDFDNFDFWPFHKKEKFNGHWAGFELGLTNFLTANNEFKLPTEMEYLELDAPKSWNFALNFLEFNIPIQKKYFGIVTGVGFEWKLYNFKSNGTLEYDVDNNIIYNEYTNALTQNTMNVNSLTIPLLAEVQIPIGKKDRRMHISAGVIGSMRTNSKISLQWEDENSSYEATRRSDFNLSTFKYAYTVRVGYRDFQIYANYEPISLFEEGKGPELYPYSVGFRLLNF